MTFHRQVSINANDVSRQMIRYFNRPILMYISGNNFTYMKLDYTTHTVKNINELPKNILTDDDFNPIDLRNVQPTIYSFT